MSLAGVAPFAVKSYEFDVEANSSWSKGSGSSVGKPEPGKFVFTKQVDPSIDAFITNIASGQAFKDGELTVSWGTGEKVIYKMTNMFVTKVLEVGEAGRPVDRIELVYRTLEWKLGSASGSWDIPNGRVK